MIVRPPSLWEGCTRRPGSGYASNPTTAAARAAGIEARVTAHSGRVGLASELTARGASTTEVMLAGNWKTARMVAHYSAGATRRTRGRRQVFVKAGTGGRHRQQNHSKTTSLRN